MATILIETRGDPRCNPILDAMAAVCAAEGHHVFRWRGPLSGRIPVSRRIKSCDLAILFNGAHVEPEHSVAKLRRSGTPILFVELGWHPQSSTIQVDAQGINAAAGWMARPLESVGQQPLTVRGNDLLVALQHDKDTQIASLSPWFRNMAEFVAHIVRSSRLPVRIRQHPRHALDARVHQLAEQFNCAWDKSPSFAAALDDCRAVACINSSSAVEALAQRLPVLCFGLAVYRHAGAVYCLTNDDRKTLHVTNELAHGRCSLFQERVDETLERILAHQWQFDDIPSKLPELVAHTLRRHSTRSKPSTTWLRLLSFPKLVRMFGGKKMPPTSRGTAA